MCIAIGTEYTTIAGFGFQPGATPGALVEQLSVVGGNVEQFHVSAFRTGQVRFQNKFYICTTFRHIQILSKNTQDNCF